MYEVSEMKFEIPANVSSQTFTSLKTDDYELEAFKTSWLSSVVALRSHCGSCRLYCEALLTTKKVSNRVPDCTAELGSN